MFTLPIWDFRKYRWVFIFLALLQDSRPSSIQAAGGGVRFGGMAGTGVLACELLGVFRFI